MPIKYCSVTLLLSTVQIVGWSERLLSACNKYATSKTGAHICYLRTKEVKTPVATDVWVSLGHVLIISG